MKDELFDLNKNKRVEVIKQSLNYMKVNGELYNLDGEYIGDKYVSDRLTIKRTINKNTYYDKKNETLLHQHAIDNGGFIFALFKYNKDILNSLNGLSKPDIARLMFIATYTHYDTGRLQKGDGTVITTDNIPDLIRLTKYRCKEYINKLLQLGVITITDKKEIVMSKAYFIRGSTKNIKKKDISYTKLYKNTVRVLFNKANNREISHLATVYMLLPYINLNHNIISKNPLEKDVSLVEAMDTTELAKTLGYSSYNKFTATINKLTIDDQPLFTYFNNAKERRKKHIVVNPRIVYGGNNAKHLESIKAMFN